MHGIDKRIVVKMRDAESRRSRKIIGKRYLPNLW